MTTPTCIVDSKNKCGEGPMWDADEQAIWWTDINGFTVQRYREGDELQTWHFDEPACALSLTTDPDRLLLALGSRVILWEPATDTRHPVARPEPDLPGHRLNDGGTDPAGAFWVGSMPNNVAPDGTPQPYSGLTGSLYRLMADGSVTTWDRNFGITNTIAWSPDRRTFYCGDSVTNVVYAYDFDEATSAISNRRDFLRFDRGDPDGSAVDAEGFLWNCRYGGSCIVRVAPTGEIDSIIEMPVANITNCAFGGADLQTLFVTTAALDDTSGDPHAGGVFAFHVDVPGLDTWKFRL